MEKRITKLDLGLLLLFLPALVFVIYRSVMLDITNDEAYSFKLVAELTRHFEGARNLMVGTANTHWLNSFFLFLEHHLLGDKVWMLRIHSVLSFVLLLYALWLIAKRNGGLVLMLLLCTLLAFNHYLFDFFSLARGYALSLAFEVLAIAYILQDAQANRQKIYLCLSLSVFANYTTIYFLLVYGLLDILYDWRTKGFRLFLERTFYAVRWSAILVLIWSVPNIYYIKYISCDLEEGQKNGFVQDTLGVFLGRTWDFLNYPATIALGALWLMILLVFYFRRRKQLSEGWRRLFETTLLVVFLIHVFYYVLHIPFPFGRTSFFLILPFLVLLAYIAQTWLARLPKYGGISFAVLIFVLNIVYVGTYRNLRVTQEWWMQQGLHQFVDDAYATYGNQLKTKRLTMSIDHWGSYHNYYQFIYPEKTCDEVVVYDRFGYAMISKEDIEHMKTCDLLLLLQPYDAFLQKNWAQPLPKAKLHYADMQTDWLVK